MRRPDGYDVLLLGLLSLVHLFLLSRYWSFTLDDAFITMRYSQHWADGHGIRWNVDQAPVEGYTSFLWMAVGALFFKLGLPMPEALKVASAASLWAVGIGTYLWIRLPGRPRVLASIAAASILWNPSIVLLGAMGMETTTAMLVAMVAGMATVLLLEGRDDRWAIVQAVAVLCGLLLRPDLAVASVVLVGGAGFQIYRTATDRFARYARTVVLWLVLPGAAYMTWRIGYFGQLFPTPFYIKTTQRLIVPQALDYVVGLVFIALGPALALLAFQERKFRRRHGAIVAMTAAGAFLLFTLRVDPIMGFAWRFQAPVIGLLLVGVSSLISPNVRLRMPFGLRDRRVVAALLCLALLIPISEADYAGARASRSSSEARAEAGLALAPFADEGYRLYTSEAGALPFYSGWHTVDHLGLNNNTLAQRGFSREFFNAYDAHVVMVSMGKGDLVSGGLHRSALGAAKAEGYELVSIDPRSASLEAFYVFLLDDEMSDDEKRSLGCAILAINERPELRDDLSAIMRYPTLSDVTAPSCDLGEPASADRL